ncbi:hypothetical protein Agub_g8998, partial [Astrephomene gubernaculifera]
MDGVRMTRSRAKALGATPITGLPAKTPDVKTTTRRGRKAAAPVVQEPSPEKKQLDFGEAAPEPEAQVETEKQPVEPSPGKLAQIDSGVQLVLENSDVQLPAQGADAFQPADERPQQETHDNPSVLMASPIVTQPAAQAAADTADEPPSAFNSSHAAAAVDPQPIAASPQPIAMSPQPIAMSPQPIAMSPQPIAMSPQPMAMSPAPVSMNPQPIAASPQPVAMSPQPVAASPQPMAMSPAPVAMSPQPIAASPQPVAESPQPMAMSPAPVAMSPQPIAMSPQPIAMSPQPIAMSPQPVAMSPQPVAATPQPIAMSPQPIAASPQGFIVDHDIPAPSPAPGAAVVDASPRPMGTPLSFTSDAPHGVPAAQPMAASMPATPLSLTSSLAEAVEQAQFSPMPDDLADSPISLSGGTGLSPQLTPQQPQPVAEQVVDADDVTMGDATPAAAMPSPFPFDSELPAAAVADPSPTANFFATPSSEPHGAAAAGTSRLSDAATGFQGFNAVALSSDAAGSPSLGNLAAGASSPTMFGSAADNLATDLGTPAVACNDTEMDAMDEDGPTEVLEQGESVAMEAPDAGQPEIAKAESSDPCDAVVAAPVPCSGSAVPDATPGAAKTPSALKPTPGKKYIHVESRYNKTPVASAKASAASNSTPVAPTNAAAAGAKSTKRVSIHTPEASRGGVALRQVVPTPFRPKSAVAAPPAQPVDVATQPPAPEDVAAAEERRAKAAERLKAIHATEKAPAGPVNRVVTHTFAVKPVKVAGQESLRQLKRQIKEAAMKKEAKAAGMSEARESKLTPKVAERKLPMPDDEEDSDEEAEYDEAQENALVSAMDSLEVAPPKDTVPVALRGLPAPQGKHLRFNEDGKASESP